MHSFIYLLAIQEKVVHKINKAGMLDFDLTFVVMAVSFIVFMVIMNHIFYKPMRRIIDRREEYINTHKDDAETKTQEAKKILAEYDSKLEKARLSGLEAIRNQSDEAKSERSQLVSDATRKATEQLETFRAAFEIEKATSVDALSNEVAPLAQQIVSKLLGTQVAISGVDNEKVKNILRG